MKIKQKLAIIFLALGVVPALLVGFFNISSMRGILEASGRNKLASITGLEVVAKLRADRVEATLGAIKGDAAMLQDSAVIRENLPELAGSVYDPAGAAYQEAKRRLDQRFADWMSGQQWASDIIVTDKRGRIVYAFNPEHFGKELGDPVPDPDHAAFENGKKGVYVGDVFIHKHKNGGDDHPGLLIAAPISDSRGGFIGEVMLAVKMELIYDFLQDRFGMGETGETMLVAERNGEIVVLNPLRFDEGAALAKKWKITDAGLAEAVKLAVRGDGSGVFTDYRGKEVYGAWHYIPAFGWGIIVKMDAVEMTKEVNDFRNLNILILIILAFIAVAAALFSANSIAHPIMRLTEVVNEISRGKLDVKLEKIDTKDEVGELARAFERVIVSLKLAMREMVKQGSIGAAAAQTTEVAETKKGESRISEAFKV